jgi:predicted phosphoadenosine phosphosulfate sulfurtransferase
MCFYDFIKKFAEWYANGKKTASFVGLRAYESKNRMNIFIGGQGFIFKNTKNTNNVYPIFDWKFSDLWHYNYKYSKIYNNIYDLMYMAGVDFRSMRVGQLFGNEQKRALHITRILDHAIWVKMLYRINGVDFTSRVSKDGYINSISKPSEKTWEEFALFICNTLPDDMKRKTSSNIRKVVSLWLNRGYSSGIPDEAPYCLEREKKVPSWRRICRSLLKNDFALCGFGINQKDAIIYRNYVEYSKNRLTHSHLF